MKEATYRERTSNELREQYDRAESLMNEKALGEAEEALLSIVEAEPGFAPAYNKLGVVEIRRGNRAGALDWFQAAVEADDNYAPALTNLGNMSLEKGDQHQAKAYFNRAIDADREYGPAHNSLGIALRQEGRLVDSVRHLRIARRSGAYRVTYDSVSSPEGRRGCLLLVGFVIAMLVGAVLLLLRF